MAAWTELREKVSMAVNFIEENLTKKLDLGEVAKQFNYSKYHLQRVFADTTGLTIHDYIKRRRLTEAAKCADLFRQADY